MGNDFIDYRNSNHAWNNYEDFIQTTILENGLLNICELGGGANPMLEKKFIEANGLTYTVIDISQSELDKAPDYYNKVCADIAGDEPITENTYDIVFSKMLAEHVRYGEKFHRNNYGLLKPGGYAVHFFPTMYAFPFFINRYMPERLASWVLNRLQPNRSPEGKNAKFPAFYSWCRGPSKKQINRFEGIGFNIDHYFGFFGHDGYYKKIPLLLNIHNKFCDALLRKPMPLLTSFAWVKLKKPKF